MPLIELKNSTKLYFESVINNNSKANLFLLSGLSGNVSAFGNIIHRLKKYFNIIVIDNRGAGRTVSYSNAFSIEDIAEDIILLMDLLKLEKAHLLGHSMGGFITQFLAVNYPERIDKIILSCTSAVMNEKTKKLLLNNCEEFKSGILTQREFNKKFLRHFTSPIIYANDFMFEAMLDFLDEYPYKQSLEGFISQVNACIKFDYSLEINKINNKTLIICGENDEISSLQDSSYLKNNINKSTLEIMKNCFHIPYVENSLEYSKIVLDFLLN